MAKSKNDLNQTETISQIANKDESLLKESFDNSNYVNYENIEQKHLDEILNVSDSSKAVLVAPEVNNIGLQKTRLVKDNIQASLMLANQLIESKSLPNTIKNAEQAALIIQKGQEMGLGGVTALNGLYYMNGRIQAFESVLLGLAQAKGMVFEVVEDFQDVLNAEGKVVDKRTTIRVLRHYPEMKHTLNQTVSYMLMEDAARAELYNPALKGKSSSPWYKHTRAMMYWRCVGIALDRYAQDIIQGVKGMAEMSPDMVDFDGDKMVLKV
jgi:hypothetical protein